MDKQDIIRMLKQYRGLHLESLRLRQRILDKRDSLYDVQAVAINGANVRSAAGLATARNAVFCLCITWRA